MAKSLLVAVLTFVCLGVYYRNEKPVSETTEPPRQIVDDARQAARSAALAGLNVAKEGLTSSWQSRLFAGRHRGAKYNAAATVRDERARIESIGRAFGAAGAAEAYRLRVEVYRSQRDSGHEDDGSPYSYRIRPVSIP